jgi:hypothetical protein
MSSLDQQIHERAFHLWEQDSRPHGRTDHYGFSAQCEMQATSSQPAAQKRTPTRKAEGSKAAPARRTTRSRKSRPAVRA